jgi:hypothetical protein
VKALVSAEPLKNFKEATMPERALVEALADGTAEVPIGSHEWCCAVVSFLESLSQPQPLSREGGWEPQCRFCSARFSTRWEKAEHEASHKASAVQGEWVMVPREPTDEMLDACIEAWPGRIEPPRLGGPWSAWAAMIAASPPYAGLASDARLARLTAIIHRARFPADREPTEMGVSDIEYAGRIAVAVMREECALAAAPPYPDLRGQPTPEKPAPNPEWEALADAAHAAIRAEVGQDEPEQTLKMLQTWKADAEPANELGQISFSRAMLDSATDALEATINSRQDALNAAWRAVDACGGVGAPDEYTKALNDACAAIEKMGGKDPDPDVGKLRADLRAAEAQSERLQGQVEGLVEAGKPEWDAALNALQRFDACDPVNQTTRPDRWAKAASACIAYVRALAATHKEITGEAGE